MALPAPKINLLAKKKALFDERSAVALKMKVVAGVVLVMYFIVMLIITGFTIYERTSLSTTQIQIDELNSTLTNQSVELREYIDGLSLLGSVQSILNQRRESIDLWNKIQQLLPNQCELTLFSMEDNVLHIGIRAPHVFLAQEVISMTESKLDSLGVSAFTSSISRSDDASYTIQLDVTLSKQQERKT